MRSSGAADFKMERAPTRSATTERLVTGAFTSRGIANGGNPQDQEKNWWWRQRVIKAFSSVDTDVGRNNQWLVKYNQSINQVCVKGIAMSRVGPPLLCMHVLVGLPRQGRYSQNCVITVVVLEPCWCRAACACYSWSLSLVWWWRAGKKGNAAAVLACRCSAVTVIAAILPPGYCCYFCCCALHRPW